MSNVVVALIGHRLGTSAWGEQKLWEILAVEDQRTPPTLPISTWTRSILSFIRLFSKRSRSIPRFQHGLRRPNTHDCRAEGGSVFRVLPPGALGGISSSSANHCFALQAPTLLRARVRSSPTLTPVLLCSPQLRARSVRTVVTCCLWITMADRPSPTMERR